MVMADILCTNLLMLALCLGLTAAVARVVLRWNRTKVIANIDDLAISIWALKVIDEVSQIDDI